MEERLQSVTDAWGTTLNEIIRDPKDEEVQAKREQFMAKAHGLKAKPLMSTTRHLHTQIGFRVPFAQLMKGDRIDPLAIERAFTSFRRSRRTSTPWT